jgi:general secretion pathway protein G
MSTSKFAGGVGGIGFRLARQRAFTLLEVLLVGALLTILATIATASYNKFTDRARNAQAAADIREIEAAITRFYTLNSRYPVDLAEVGVSKNDPWGNAYDYLDFTGLSSNIKKRKDGNLWPINSDYDLYSRGKDTGTTRKINIPPGADDIVRGRNGRYIGLGKDYH